MALRREPPVPPIWKISSPARAKQCVFFLKGLIFVNSFPRVSELSRIGASRLCKLFKTGSLMKFPSLAMLGAATFALSSPSFAQLDPMNPVPGGATGDTAYSLARRLAACAAPACGPAGLTLLRPVHS